MLLAELVGAAWLSGLLNELLPGAAPALLSSVGFAAYAALFGLGCLHARVYLGLATWAPRADRLLALCGFALLALAPWFGWALPIAARLLLVWGGTAVAVMLLAVSLMARHRRIELSGFIVAAWAAYLLFALAYLLPRLTDNFFAASYLGPLSVIQGMVVATLFGFAMTHRLLGEKRRLELAQREAELHRQRAEAMMTERYRVFAATNHDLRQPLQGVSLYAGLLAAVSSDDKRREFARKLETALAEVDSQLVGIQQLAAVHESGHQPSLQDLDLDAVLAPLIEEYRSRAESKRLTIRYVPSTLRVSTHRPYLQRIVRNLLSNALRYTADGGRILVGCRRAGGPWLWVVDNGRGMGAEEVRLAFEAFRRFDEDNAFHQGMGLGLFSTKSLANALGLRVELRSRAEHGTAVGISLTGADPGAGRPASGTIGNSRQPTQRSANAIEPLDGLR